MSEKMEFQTEVKELLHLMIHSLYSNREIFIRELISNGSDALDKLRFESIAKPELVAEDKELRIDVRFDEEQKTVIIEDNGIGMNRDDLIANIGTIARSGTKSFVKNLSGEEKHDMNLIGQFGVGFYSVFMVADKVDVYSKRAGEEQGWHWSSEGAGEFELEECEKSGRGTRIIAHIKQDDENKEFVSEWKLRSIIKKYSEYVTHPIYLHTMQQEYDKDGKPEGDPKPNAEHLNEKPAIWRRAKSDVTDEQYKEFYSHINMGDNEPLQWSHNHVEGVQEYHSLLYVPSKAPFGIYNSEQKHGLKLYVKRVFIMEDCKELLPSWLRFMRGVVDSEDLPLNVSREILQSNKIIDQIKKHVTKKSLEMLQKVADDDSEKYISFFKELGNVLKEGFYMNWEHLDELKSLLRFQSTHDASDSFMTSLKDYVSRMPEDQKDIYFITGETRGAVENSPHLEGLKAKGYEVLFMVDPIDEWVTQSLTEFDGKKLKNITKGDIELEKSEEEKKEEKEKKSEFKALIKAIQKQLDADIKEVRISSRLQDSPSCLVSEESDMSANMERILKMSNQAVTKTKRIMEINPKHPINQYLLKQIDAKAQIDDWVDVLYNQALLAEGSEVAKPGEFVKKMNKLLANSLA
jgi:molecular chaperone HtpG